MCSMDLFKVVNKGLLVEEEDISPPDKPDASPAADAQIESEGHKKAT